MLLATIEPTSKMVVEINLITEEEEREREGGPKRGTGNHAHMVRLWWIRLRTQEQSKCLVLFKNHSYTRAFISMVLRPDKDDIKNIIPCHFKGDNC